MNSLAKVDGLIEALDEPLRIQGFGTWTISTTEPREYVSMADKITRIAIVDANRCKPKRCAQECKKVRTYTRWLLPMAANKRLL
jgi:hypothetical protein